MNVSDTIRDSALRYYNLAASSSFTKGRQSRLVVAVCLYAACQNAQFGDILIDLSDINLFVLGATYLHSETISIGEPEALPTIKQQERQKEREEKQKTRNRGEMGEDEERSGSVMPMERARSSRRTGREARGLGMSPHKLTWAHLTSTNRLRCCRDGGTTRTAPAVPNSIFYPGDGGQDMAIDLALYDEHANKEDEPGVGGGDAETAEEVGGALHRAVEVSAGLDQPEEDQRLRKK
ncbi:transcription factor TFIIIB subunit brf1 [Tulasnella sp. 417]|nr:transcription factor TFIIIB subunit brf1 [Tulasnella sp. 417]